MISDSYQSLPSKPDARARRKLRSVWFLAAVAILGFHCSPKLCQATDNSRPNIIVLLADDQCTYSMGCYGTPGVKTPNLDQLARDGMVFDRHYDTTAICMASRVNIMTGLYEFKAGCNFDSGNLLRRFWQQSYPVLLRQSGYKTAFAGKFGFLVSEEPDQRGVLPEQDFDRWGGGPGQTFYETAKNRSMAEYADEYPHSTLSYGAFARDFIRDAASMDAPFCLSISFKAPHHPVQPDPQFDEVYQGVHFEKPPNFGREFGEHLAAQSKQGRQFERFHSWNYSSDYQGVMAKYYQQIYAIDVAVGMMRQALNEHGMAHNTVILYTSDNGFLCGSHGYGSKVLPYEEASRVPLLVYDPRLPSDQRGQRCDALTANVDIAATVLKLAEQEPPAEMDGRDLSKLLRDPSATLHEYVPLINVWGPKQVHSLGIVTREGKYVYWPFAADGFQAAEEVFDMRGDRLETQNVIADPHSQAMVQKLREYYQSNLNNWRNHGVPFHGYQRFAVIFDPSVSWSSKAALYAN